MTHRLLALCILLTASAQAADLRVLTWNVESSNADRQTSDPATIAVELIELQRDYGPFDLIGLTEVPGVNAATYTAALQLPQRNYTSLVSDTGGSDRMLIAFDRERFDLVSQDTGLTAISYRKVQRRRLPLAPAAHQRQMRLDVDQGE